MKNTKILSAILGGIATGIAFGILFAPDRGTSTRNKLTDSLRFRRNGRSSLNGKATATDTPVRTSVDPAPVNTLKSELPEPVIKKRTAPKNGASQKAKNPVTPAGDAATGKLAVRRTARPAAKRTTRASGNTNNSSNNTAS